MAGFYENENKVRPGTYIKYQKANDTETSEYTDGVVSTVLTSSWGPLMEVVEVDSLQSAIDMFGNDGTADVLQQLFIGGALSAYAVRLGTGGTKGVVALQDSGDVPSNAINATALYVGDKNIEITIKDSIVNIGQKEIHVFSDSIMVEKLMIPISDSEEVDALVASKSNFVEFIKVEGYVGNGKIASVNQAILTGGTNPTVTNEDYSTAFVYLEPYDFNVMVINSVDTALSGLLAAYIARVYEEGKNVVAVIGQLTTVALSTRMQEASAFNSYNIVYCGGGWLESNDVKVEGYAAAARIAGMIASTPSTLSLTHMKVVGALRPIELLTPNQYVETILAGMLTFSQASDSGAWIESGINTLVNLPETDDEGWKKIKRTKVRMELFTRCQDATDLLVGKIPAISDGYANVLQVVQGVVTTMIAEQKLGEDTTVFLVNTGSDYASYGFDVYDIDTLEKFYLDFTFRF